MHVLFKANLYVVLIFDANGEAFIDMTLREIATVVIVKFIFNSISIFNSILYSFKQIIVLKKTNKLKLDLFFVILFTNLIKPA